MDHDKSVMLLMLPIGLGLLSMMLLFDQFFTDNQISKQLLMILRYAMIIIVIIFLYLFKVIKKIRAFLKTLYVFYSLVCLFLILTQLLYKPNFDSYIVFNVIFVMVYANLSMIKVRFQLLLYSLFFSLSYLFVYYFSVFETAELITRFRSFLMQLLVAKLNLHFI